jgi:hypothetical protein
MDVGELWEKQRPMRRALRTSDTAPNLSHRNSDVERGVYYDYPSCCVEEFSKNPVPVLKLSRERFCASMFYPFIPCQAHANAHMTLLGCDQHDHDEAGVLVCAKEKGLIVCYKCHESILHMRACTLRPKHEHLPYFVYATAYADLRACCARALLAEYHHRKLNRTFK